MTPLSRQQFAELLKVSPATITNWMDAGMPAQRTGRQKSVVRISLEKALPWVVAHRETKGSERERLASAQADKVELENATRCGELIESERVADVLARLGAELVARHDGLPGRVAGELAGISDPAVIRSRLRDELRSVRRAFAQATEELADALGAFADTGGDSQAAPEADGQRVGRRVQGAAARKRGAGTVPK